MDSTLARRFRSTVESLNYHFSAAFYIRVVAGATQTDPKSFNFAWIAAEKEGPYAHKFVAATPTTLDAGNTLVDRALKSLQTCMKEEKWPGYADNWEELELSPYYLRSIGL